MNALNNIPRSLPTLFGPANHAPRSNCLLSSFSPSWLRLFLFFLFFYSSSPLFLSFILSFLFFFSLSRRLANLFGSCQLLLVCLVLTASVLSTELTLVYTNDKPRLGTSLPWTSFLPFYIGYPFSC